MSTDAPAPVAVVGPTLANLVFEWLDHIEIRLDLTLGTKQVYARLGGHVAVWGVAVPLSHVDLGPYVEHRRGTGLAARTIAMEVRVAGMLLNWGRRTHRLPLGAFIYVPRVKVDKGVFLVNHRTPTPEEVAKVIAAMPEGDWRLATVVLAKTGARIGEVCALRSCDLDLDDRVLVFGTLAGNSKTGVRRFPLDRGLVRLLRGREGRGDKPLFDFGEVTVPRQKLPVLVHRACEIAEVPPFTPHGLRRMVVSRLIRSGVDIGTAATLTGHSVRVMLSCYQVVTDDDRRAGARRARLGTLRSIRPTTRRRR